MRENRAVAPLLQGIKRPIILELGAHIGTTTASLRKHIPNTLYYAFEPDIRNLRILRSLFHGKDIHIIPKAVGQIDGQVPFWQSSGINKVGRIHTDSSSIKKPVAHKKMFPWMSFQKTTCDCIRLDTFVRAKGIDHVDLIWADVQGAELDVIAGGQEAFKITKWFYTEHMDKPRYKGQPNLGQILKALPGNWSAYIKWEMDALLQNRDYKGK